MPVDFWKVVYIKGIDYPTFKVNAKLIQCLQKLCGGQKNKSGEFKMTHQATANRFSLFSLMAPFVASLLSWG